ncbi:YihY/virulence factor BrkB family protein [Frigidibacter sp. RF13]|uniref:YihY/virulence factor BrkB family protein n=1 Tax=Frigidibacter sp. RF13 TaxID=2997340 RepID=UPI00226F8E4B|nr:YihY/virulence factor BrkB family protein [Frigidibacter sp. RF13]MCY1126418.1 YihY/virulence factor BrkB family protein [Frigidibacter sp. RF13]
MADDPANKANEPGFRHLAAAVWRALDERHLGLIAAGVAFYSIFAIFPGMAATIAIWGIFADPAVVSSYMEAIHGVIPDEAYSLIAGQLDGLISANASGWHWAAALPIVIAFYSVHSAVAALISGLNAVQARRHRPSLKRIFGSLALTLSLIVLILAALVLAVAVPVALSFVPLGSAGAIVLRFVPWIVLFIVVKVTLGLFYRWGATSEGARHSWVSTGSLVAAFLWAAVSFAFSLYLENFNSYNRVYGSIGAVIALMMWLYLSAYIVLFGAVLNAEIARLKRA